MIFRSTKQGMPSAIALYLLTEAQLVPEPPWPTFPSFIAQCVPIQHGTSHWPLGVSCPGCAPSQPPGCQDSVRRWKVLNLEKAVLSNNQNTMFLILNPKYSTIPVTRWKINSMQPNPGHFVSVLSHEHHVVNAHTGVTAGFKKNTFHYIWPTFLHAGLKTPRKAIEVVAICIFICEQNGT